MYSVSSHMFCSQGHPSVMTHAVLGDELEKVVASQKRGWETFPRRGVCNTRLPNVACILESDALRGGSR
jgi:hypothetical protein